MIPVLIGYFPKKTLPCPDWLKANHVKEVCSASACISKGPSGWIDAWKHNGHWLYDSPEIASSVIGEGEESFEMYAFSQYPIRVEHGSVEKEEVAEPNVMPLPDDFELLGYDAVSR